MMDFLEELSQEELAAIDDAERCSGEPESKRSKVH